MRKSIFNCIKKEDPFEKPTKGRRKKAKAIFIISQIFSHLAINLGILPIIGISLPLVSYGGSGLIAFFAALGILQNIKKQAS